MLKMKVAGYIRVRWDEENGRWYIGLGVDRYCLRKKVASISLGKLFKKHQEINEFYANIDPENHLSLELFEKEGFKEHETTDKHIVFVYENPHSM